MNDLQSRPNIHVAKEAVGEILAEQNTFTRLNALLKDSKFYQGFNDTPTEHYLHVSKRLVVYKLSWR